MKKLENIDWTHSFFELGPDFYQAKAPDPVAAPYLIDGNPEAAALIDLDPSELDRKEFVEYQLVESLAKEITQLIGNSYQQQTG